MLARHFPTIQGLLALAASFGLAGCGQKNQYVEPPPPEVTVVEPRQQNVARYLGATGTVQPIVTVEIRARVRGFLKERHFEEGSLVEKGQLLLVIDEEPFQVKLDQAKAMRDEARAALHKAERSRAGELAQAKLALDEAALEHALSNEARLRKLIDGNVVTEDEFERAESLRKQAEAQVESSRVALGQSRSDVETNILAARASLAAAETAVRNAEIELEYCRMTAPISGRISEVNHDLGNLVGDGQASLLATIVQLDPVHVYLTLSESDLLQFEARPGAASGAAAPVEMGLAGEEGFPHQGTIDYRDPAIDPGTGTIRLRGRFENPRGTIIPGTFVRLRLAIDEQLGALLVPERALGTDQSGQFVLVVGEGDVVEYRNVEAGSRLGDLRVVEGAIHPGDRVVVEGLLRARPGLKVTPRLAVEGTAAAGLGEPAQVRSAERTSTGAAR